MMIIHLGLMVCTALATPALGRSKLTRHELSTLTSQYSGNISCTRDYSCLDCTTVQVCAPSPDGQSLYEIKRFKCDSRYPYCNFYSGTCSHEMDPTCYNTNVTISNNFTCMRDGYFPDPYNCSVYYHCQNEVATQYYCLPPFPYYYPGDESCVSYNYYCANTSYPANQCQLSYMAGRKVGVLGSDYGYNYFLYCGLNNSVITVDRCIGSYIFDSDTQVCVQHCPHAGLFPRDDDCANYYKCSPTSHIPYSGFLITNMTCPGGQAFSETEYACVDRSLVPNCQVPYPALYNK